MRQLIIVMAILLIGCHTGRRIAARPDIPVPSGVSYSGHDGSSFERAVVINGATGATGVRAMYVWLAQTYPGYHHVRESLTPHEGRTYDILAFRTANGEQKRVYFDITGFYGKQ